MTKAADNAIKADEAPKPTATDEIVEAWLDEHVRNSALSDNTTSWNHLIDKLPLLKAALNKE